MSILRPKFCVGEVVDVVAYRSGRVIFSGVEVISIHYHNNWCTTEGGNFCGWGYSTSKSEGGLPYIEIMLRKRREDDNWQPLIDIWNPVKETV